LRLEGLVAGLSGEVIIRDALEGKATEAAELGGALGRQLLQRGAESLLSGLTR
jgi:hypothetical protein